LIKYKFKVAKNKKDEFAKKLATFILIT